MDEYLQANRNLWDEWTTEHEQSPFYDVPAFKAGKDRLRSIELEELGDVRGKRLLHLQCHFGMDTLAWARRGAIATGVDFSERSIALARSLSQELNIPADFICSDVENLPAVLFGEFDIVFTSYGVLHWLRDLKQWAEIIAHFLAPGGIFYIVEDHPFMRILGAGSETELKLANPYFFPGPDKIENVPSYATGGQGDMHTFYIWNHTLGEVINVLIGAGLRIEFLHEFPYAARAKFDGMKKGEDNWWRLTRQDGLIPFLFSLQARKTKQ
ncbi:MAG: class I SAM-dependent methyltransferase [Chloroflexi bacterium]|nr:class I SAM-dependent methyltransferase [Chloroflexota bacterium]MCI0576175.1 class I SAM-dependent methyltransferase [Chloroflexota bacterium]MCI0648972.1 class I SAM-dependent methyltransferase [Chloroflexota bacterium]MCI0728188.1 class I SAM-dependent methyltransferase [Chloroflexota bacterium]